MSLLMISVDDLAAFVFLKSLYGGTVHTPNLDRLMAMGTTFDNAFSQVALCNPSRTSALTGLSPAHTGVHQNALGWWNAVSPEQTLIGQMTTAGYDTSLIGKVLHSNNWPEDPGIRLANHIFRVQTGVGGNEIGVMTEADEASNGDTLNVQYALDLLQTYSAGDDFAMFVGINKPHLNWVVPQEFYDLYPLEDIVMVDNIPGDLDDLGDLGLWMTGERRWAIDPADAGPEAMQGYLAAISYADYLVGQLLDQLDAQGLTESTTIVLWTDHGYHLGDKDQWGKFTLWEDAARAPFIIAQPGTADDGQHVDQVVELMDLMPTILELMGMPQQGTLDGRSLTSFIENPALLDDGIAITSMNGHMSLRTNDYRYIRYADGSEELYVADDVHNFYNLASDPAYSDALDALRAQLFVEARSDGWELGVGSGTLEGTAQGETLVPMHETILRGGDGDDTYLLLYPRPSSVTIIETATGGYDTIRHDYLQLQVPENIERIISTETGSIIWGNAGDEYFVGGDVIYAGAGNDRIESGARDDYIDGGYGDDFIHGGLGFDTVDYSLSPDPIYMRWRIVWAEGYGRDDLRSIEHVIGSPFADLMYGTPNADVIEGNGGEDTIFGEKGNDTLIGGITSDHLIGGLGDDILTGGYGWDFLEGSEGWDRLDGGNGNDVLWGGNGRDIMDGGKGNDRYVFHSIFETSVANPDRILTLEKGDTIDLTRIDANINTAADDAFSFIGNAAFSGVAGQLRYINGMLYGDVNGDKVADFAIAIDNGADLSVVSGALLL